MYDFMSLTSVDSHVTIKVQTFPSCQEVPSCPFAVDPLSQPQHLATTNLISVPVILLCKDVMEIESYSKIAICVWLLSLRIMHLKSIRVLVYISVVVCSVLLLSGISLYRYTVMCLFIHQLMNIWAISSFSYYEWSCSKHSQTGLCVDVMLSFPSSNS